MDRPPAKTIPAAVGGTHEGYAEARRSFLDDLAELLADRAMTVVHVSHRADEALRLADRVAVLTLIGAPA